MITDLVALPLLLLACGTATVTGLLLRQQQRDHVRRTYRIVFPQDLTDKQVSAFLSTLSGIGHHASFVFEVSGDAHAIVFRLKLPYAYDDIKDQLRTAIPGVSIAEEHNVPHPQWTYISEALLQQPSRPLSLPKDMKDLSTRLLTTLSSSKLKAGESLMIQWVVSPTAPEPLPEKGAKSHEFKWQHVWSGNEAEADELNDRREKLKLANWHCSLRIAAVAKKPEHAKHMVMNVIHQVASTNTGPTKFKPHPINGLPFMSAQRQDRVTRGTTPLHAPIRLSLPELTGLVAWPIGGPLIMGLNYVRGKQFPPSNAISSRGIGIGRSNYPEMERPIAVDFKQALMHIYCCGATGSGKSNVLGHIGRQIMEAGHGMIVMELEGNLYETILNYIPPSRMKDVILLDFADRQYPVGFNLMDQGKPAEVTQRLMELFAHKYGRGIMSDDHILHGMMTLAENPKLTLLDLAPLMGPLAEQVEWSDNVIRQVRDSELKRWWQFNTQHGRVVRSKDSEPLIRRIAQITSPTELRYIFGQSKSAFKMDDVLLQNKILLINFKGVPKGSAVVAGTLISDQIWGSIRSVGDKKKRPSYLLMDEFEDFMDLPIETNTMLAQARKYNLGLVLANQFISQLTKPVQGAIITNARTKIALQGNDEDGRILAKEFGGGVTPDDFKNLPEYQAIASIKTEGGKTAPVSIKTYPPAKSTGLAEEIRQRSREQYGTWIDDIKAELEKRYEVANPAPKPKTRTGASAMWGHTPPKGK